MARVAVELPYVAVLERTTNAGPRRLAALGLSHAVVAGLRRGGHRVVEIDLGRPVARPGRRKTRATNGGAEPTVARMHGRPETLPIRSGSVDAVIVGPAVAIDAAWLGAEAGRVVRPGGVVVAERWVGDGLRGRLHTWIRGKLSERTLWTGAFLHAGLAEIGQADVRPRRRWPAVLTWGRRRE